MKMLFASTLMLLYSATHAYKMGALITCMEQNDESPIGYRDPVWNDPLSEECVENPDLCEAYLQEPYPGRGDVCDHTDPQSGLTRDACYFNTIFGEEQNDEKTWSYKCWALDRCPLKDENGNGRVGCNVNEKRINCCCKDDYCNGDELIRLFAQWGRPDHYPPDFDEICSYDMTGWYVKFDVPGYEHCGNDPDDPSKYDTPQETQIEEYIEEQVEQYSDNNNNDDNDDYSPPAIDVQSYLEEQGYSSAQSGAFAELEKEEQATEQSVTELRDLFFIFAMFFVGAVCLATGVFVGGKWKSSVAHQEKYLQAQQLDI